MNDFEEYGGCSSMGRDPVLESALKECKTEEEKDKVVDEYITMRIKIVVIGVVSFIVVVALIGIIAFLSH